MEKPQGYRKGTILVLFWKFVFAQVPPQDFWRLHGFLADGLEGMARIDVNPKTSTEVQPLSSTVLFPTFGFHGAFLTLLPMCLTAHSA